MARAGFRTALAALGVSMALTSAAAEPNPPPSSAEYMSLRTDLANARRGPSGAQPVVWVYKRRGLPVQVLGRSGDYVWIRDQDGDASWMHVSQLSARRTAVVLGDDATELLPRPRAALKPKATLEPGVIAELRACEGGWRRVTAEGVTGWIPADRLFGAEGCAAL